MHIFREGCRGEPNRLHVDSIRQQNYQWQAQSTQVWLYVALLLTDRETPTRVQVQYGTQYHAYKQRTDHSGQPFPIRNSFRMYILEILGTLHCGVKSLSVVWEGSSVTDT